MCLDCHIIDFCFLFILASSCHFFISILFSYFFFSFSWFFVILTHYCLYFVVSIYILIYFFSFFFFLCCLTSICFYLFIFLLASSYFSFISLTSSFLHTLPDMSALPCWKRTRPASLRRSTGGSGEAAGCPTALSRHVVTEIPRTQQAAAALEKVGVEITYWNWKLLL